MEIKSFSSLVEQFLGVHLPDRLTRNIPFPELPSDTQGFILRMLALMQRAGYSPFDFTVMLTRMLSIMIPNMLPAAWQGQVPPITMSGRHGKIDAYVAGQVRPAADDRLVFIDIGCGFPPLTTVDTAKKFPAWHIYGIDRNFARYVVYDGEGNYACFSRNGNFQYFQPQGIKAGRELYANPEKTRMRFSKIFADLHPSLIGDDDRKRISIDDNGHKLVENHVRDFETDNLTLIESDLETAQLPSARVIRCMNVLLYFKPEIRKKMMVQLSGLLDDGGILIAGTNGNNLQARYFVYQKCSSTAEPAEFAFSLDNLRPFGLTPWFTLHENDPEASLLAELTGTIRNDQSFWPAFNRRFDDLLDRYGVCRRTADGFLHLHGTEPQPEQVIGNMGSLWQQIAREGYLDGAVDVLRQSGWEAWKNPIDDIAVRPPLERFLSVEYGLQR